MNGDSLNFLKLNARWLTSGIILLLLGYVLMGWNSSQAISYEGKLFAWHKVTLAPVVLLLGYACIGISIFARTKK